MTESLVIEVLARIYVDDIVASLPLYQQLSGGEAAHRFTFGNVSLARVGLFLLVQGADERVRSRAATVIVRDIEAVSALIRAEGGTAVEGPAAGPNGQRLIARHADGTIVEYIESQRPVGVLQ